MILALFLLILAPPYLLPNADTLIVSNWTADEGLPGNSVNHIAQDADGFLWLSTYYGLIRFDGIEFNALNQANTPEIRNNRLNLFHKAPDGSVWISFELRGLVRYDSSGFTPYDSEDGLSDEHITLMETLPDGRFVVGSYDGLYVFMPEQNRFKRIDLGQDRQRNHIRRLTITSTGQIWISTFNGYAKLTGNEAQLFGSGLVTDIVEDAAGTVWIGTSDGLWLLSTDGSVRRPRGLPSVLSSQEITSLHLIDRMMLVSVPGMSFMTDGIGFTRVGGVPIPQDDQITSVLRDSYGVNWILTQKGVPLVLREGRFNIVRELQALEVASAVHVIEDNERNLWFSSRYGGLFRLKRNPLTHIGRLEGLRGDNTLGLFIDKKNRLFVGTRDDGFSVISEGVVRNYPRDASRRYGTVYDFAEDPKGRIWIGTFPHGLVLFDEPSQSLVTYRLGSSVLENDIRAIHASDNGFLWLATSSGLVRFDTDERTFTRFDRSKGLPSHSLKHITVDSKNRFWISTSDNGIFRFDPVSQDILHLNKATGLPSDNIRFVMMDPEVETTLWIGSETHGLIRYRDGDVRSISVEDGLPDRVVHTIQQGPMGWLWLSTNAGVVRIEKRGLNAYLDGIVSGYHFIIYDEDEGMRNLEANGGFRSGSLINREKSHILVSTQGGVTFFPLGKPDPDRRPPPVYVYVGARHGRTMTIELERGRDDLDIRYAGLRFASPYGIRYQYRLVGKTTEWTDDFDRNTLHFHDLSPGDYRFEVMAWNEAGTLASEPAVLTIVVKPTFWQNPWFRFLSLLLLGGGVWALIHQRTKTLKSIRERLEVIVSERTQDLRNEKAEVEKQKAIIEQQAANLADLIETRDKFFAIIGHDLRGPFQTLLGLSQLMIDDYEEMDDHELRQSLKHLRSSSENLHRLVENLLEWSTLQKGNMKLLIEPVDINALAESSVRLFGPSASFKGIHLEAIVPDAMVVNADASVVETIVRNFISNSIKFTKTEGIVVLEAGQSETQWWIQVSDNGIGMSESMRKNVLNIDKSIKRRGTVNEWGTGLGLALCNELMKVHGGEIVVESEPDIGSRFTARFNNRS